MGPAISDLFPKPRSARLASVESYRVIAILLVIFLHSNFIGRLHIAGAEYGYLVHLPLYLVFWISVPFFFLVAGYFYGKRIDAGHDPIAVLRGSSWSLFLVFVIWMLVYAVFPRNWWQVMHQDGIWPTLLAEAMQTLALVRNDHIKLVLIPRPPIYHLWFLYALILGLATVAGVIVCRLEKAAIGLIIGCYGLAVATELSPSASSEPIRRIACSSPCSAPSVGVVDLSAEAGFCALALWLIAGGFVLAFTEGPVLKLVWHASPKDVAWHSYAGGILMVTGIFLYTFGETEYRPGHDAADSRAFHVGGVRLPYAY